MFAQLNFSLRCAVVENSAKFQKLPQLNDPPRSQSYGIALLGGRVSLNEEPLPTEMHTSHQKFRQTVSTRIREMRFVIQRELNKPYEWNQASRFECPLTYSEPPYH